MEYDYIKCGDCLTLMKELPDKSVDVCFTSPPYNDVGKDGGQHQKYIEVETRNDWFEGQCEVIDEMLRLSKKLVLYNVQGIKNNRRDLYKIIGKYADRIHDIIIGNKATGTPCGTPNKISNRYEMLILIKPIGVNVVNVNTTYGFTNVINSNGNRNNPYSNIHKAVMEKGFCDTIIKEFTSKDDIVLDPFSGMGTTALCCVENERHYIGFEISEVYYNKSIERISQASINLWNHPTDENNNNNYCIQGNLF